MTWLGEDVGRETSRDGIFKDHYDTLPLLWIAETVIQPYTRHTGGNNKVIVGFLVYGGELESLPSFYIVSSPSV